MHYSDMFLGEVWISDKEIEYLGTIIPIGTKFTFTGFLGTCFQYVA